MRTKRRRIRPGAAQGADVDYAVRRVLRRSGSGERRRDRREGWNELVRAHVDTGGNRVRRQDPLIAIEVLRGQTGRAVVTSIDGWGLRPKTIVAVLRIHEHRIAGYVPIDADGVATTTVWRAVRIEDVIPLERRECSIASECILAPMGHDDVVEELSSRTI